MWKLLDFFQKKVPGKDAGNDTDYKYVLHLNK